MMFLLTIYQTYSKDLIHSNRGQWHSQQLELSPMSSAWSAASSALTNLVGHNA